MSWHDLPTDTRASIVRALTPRQREIVIHRHAGHSWRTIARALHLSEATVRGHQEAATRRLQDELGGDGA